MGGRGAKNRKGTGQASRFESAVARATAAYEARLELERQKNNMSREEYEARYAELYREYRDATREQGVTGTQFDELRREVAALPKTGAKVQEAFIKTMRYLTNVDLTKARDTQFDTRRFFNIDERQLSRNEWAEIRTNANRQSLFDVDIQPNGRYRWAIVVRKR